jgi:alkanesulfonate monooxygenase SsuD/methylene tetrahydromethanopterin reductase-like flavin-dependent oxidoreductase (luciferase family)
MRVGVVILPQYRWPEARARWESLQDRGFAHGWTYDHLAWRDLAEQPWFGTIPTLTAAAAVTDTLRLGTWVSSPNFRHPVTLAKDLMTIDDIATGRLLAGIGAGGIGWDATVLGQSRLTPGQRVDRLDEFVTVLDLLLTQAETSWQGDYFVVDRARMIPSGSRSRIPLIVAANGRRTIEIAATRADAWATTGPEATDSSVDEWWAAVGELVRRFEATATRAGRDASAIDRYLNLDSAPVLSVSSMDAFTDAAGRAAALGFTDVIVHWPRPDGIYAGDDGILDRIADRLTGGELTPG